MFEQPQQDTKIQRITRWMILDAIPSIQKRTIFKLLSKHPIEQLFQLSPDQLRHYKLSEKQISALLTPNFQQIEQNLAWINELQNKQIICFDSDAYPTQLKEISSPPFILYLHGNASLLKTPQIALIGSRRCSPYGQNKAYQFAGELAQRGMTITSGLALGIDGFSHQGALDKQGNTIAVLGTGLDNIYPKRHNKLAQQIIENGLLVSEFWPSTPALPSNFPRRNRIISGLSLGIFVVEAAVKSGSLITARYAAEQNRDLFALPGSIDNPEACGCLSLIQNGAKCVMQPQDILNEYPNLQLIDEASQPIKTHFHSVQQQTAKQQISAYPLLKYIDYHLTSLDTLLHTTGLDIVTLQNQLIELEMAGVISVTAQGYLRN